MTARLAVPAAPAYPFAALAAGLSRVGYALGGDDRAQLLVAWAPWNGTARQALQRRYAAAGRPVIVAENGWLSPLGGHAFYQLALDGWNGGGRWPAGGPERWDGWRVPLAPWRDLGAHVLVLGQRGHPADRRTAPPGWHETISLATPRAVVRRGRHCTVPLAVQLRGAHCAVAWTSNAASHALVAGVPVFHAGAPFLCRGLALPLDGADLERPAMPERLAECRRLAWAQWTAEEIAGGEPLRRLLDLHATGTAA